MAKYATRKCSLKICLPWSKGPLMREFSVYEVSTYRGDLCLILESQSQHLLKFVKFILLYRDYPLIRGSLKTGFAV